MAEGRRIANGVACMALALLGLLSIGPHLAQATFPGRPGLIVFNRVYPGPSAAGLYAIDPHRKHLRQLTDGYRDDEPSFAPSGRKLVFTRFSETERGIFTLDLHSGKTRRLTAGESDRSPAFGPRGRVVFSRLSPLSGSHDLFLRTPAGRLRQLTFTSADDVDPVFTPDGSKILFTQAHLGSFSSGEPPPPKISLIRIDGGGLRDIEGLTGASHVDISPDGRYLIFRGPPGFEAWRKRLDGGKPQLIAEGAWIPAYSPDGRGFAYSLYRELWIGSVDDFGNPKLVSELDEVTFHLEWELGFEPAWQPLP
jgi:dipeptidyl aminopeptidase/acylaminoacyl peptidase